MHTQITLICIIFQIYSTLNFLTMNWMVMKKMDLFVGKFVKLFYFNFISFLVVPSFVDVSPTPRQHIISSSSVEKYHTQEHNNEMDRIYN